MEDLNLQYLVDLTSQQLVREAHEARLLKQLMATKLTKYSGIKHDELETICVMFGIIEPKEEQPVE